jgi:hypothetical protein
MADTKNDKITLKNTFDLSSNVGVFDYLMIQMATGEYYLMLFYYNTALKKFDSSLFLINESEAKIEPIIFDNTELIKLIEGEKDIQYMRYLKLKHSDTNKLDLVFDGTHTKFFNF